MQVDVWAAGCVVFECLFGRPPFARDTEGDTQRAILAAGTLALPPIPHVSGECAHFLQARCAPLKTRSTQPWMAAPPLAPQ